MKELIWKCSDISLLCANAREWENCSMGWDDESTPEPGLFFVHDEGVYLMPNREYKEGESASKLGEVLYAKGMSPQDDGYWDNAYEAVGGDDFAEIITLREIFGIIKNSKIPSPLLELVIEVDEETYTISVRTLRSFCE